MNLTEALYPSWRRGAPRTDCADRSTNSTAGGHYTEPAAGHRRRHRAGTAGFIAGGLGGRQSSCVSPGVSHWLPSTMSRLTSMPASWLMHSRFIRVWDLWLVEAIAIYTNAIRRQDWRYFRGHDCNDAVGEAFDKVAVMLGLPYPGGVLT